jgi:hypothetical protein
MVTCQGTWPQRHNGGAGIALGGDLGRLSCMCVARVLAEMSTRVLLTYGRLLACAAALAWLCALSLPASSEAAAKRRARATPHKRVSGGAHRHVASHPGGRPRHAGSHRRPTHTSHPHGRGPSGRHKHARNAPSSPPAKKPSAPSSGHASPISGGTAPGASPSGHTPTHGTSPGASHAHGTSPGASHAHGTSPGASHAHATSPGASSAHGKSSASPAHHSSPSSPVKPAKTVGHPPSASVHGKHTSARSVQQRPAPARAGSQTAKASVNSESSGSVPYVAQTPAALHLATSSRSSLPLVIGAVAAGLVIALLFVDGLGYGPRHQPRRRSWLRRRMP